MLEWLQDSSVAQWVAASPWGYPITLTTHGVGLALVVGVVLIVSLRVLGFFPGIPLAGMRRLMPYMWVGFVLNFLSGVGLFITDAERFFFSTTFQLKMLFIVIGLIVVVTFDKVVLKPAAQAPGQAVAIPGFAKPLAAMNILMWWFAVVLSGRLIAYLTA